MMIYARIRLYVNYNLFLSKSQGGTMVRPIGITKTKRMFGYKYTPEEYEEMTKALEKFKAENNCTTSKALYILITQKNK